MLGENIYNLRKENKLSQEQLAEKINVTRQTISNWELGETSPNPEQLKLLSSVLNVSIDELLNNDIKSVIVERVSNTEKLAGIIIKILKFFGIAFIVMLVIDIIAFITFVFVKKDMRAYHTEEITMTCHKSDNDYLISVATDGYFNCSNCNTIMQEELKSIVDYGDVTKNEKIITEYFKNNNGTCE